MKKLLMCVPDYYGVEYNINPWMTDNIGKVHNKLATNQWFTFYYELIKHIDVYIINGVKGLPDLVFTANAGFVEDNTVLLSHFANPQRSPEENVFRQWFLTNNYTVIQQNRKFFEGAGDLISDQSKRKFVGYGFRSEQKIFGNVHKCFSASEYYTLKLIDPRFYHLDTCFCPLDKDTVMYYDKAIASNDLANIKHLFKNHIVVTEEEALKFCCNAVVIDRKVFMPECETVANKLSKLGFEVQQFDMSEFIKSGGACKCLTLEV